MNDLKVPSLVRIIEPLPGEEGRLLLLARIGDEYRVGVRGKVRSYGRNELEEWPEFLPPTP